MKEIKNEQALVHQLNTLFQGQPLDVIAKVSGVFLFTALGNMSQDQCLLSLSSIEDMVIKIYERRFGGFTNEQ